MSGGIHTHGTRDIPDLCPWCVKPLRVQSSEWTGGPTGFTAHVECRGCDMRGPCVPFVYPTEAEAVDLAARIWRREEAAMDEFKSR
jgi:hypothetical protein